MGFVDMLSSSKADQILSSYRPIAPKPPQANGSPSCHSPVGPSKPSYFHGKSSGRGKKRTRGGKSVAACKKFKTHCRDLVSQTTQLQLGLFSQCLQHGLHCKSVSGDGEFVSLPLLPCLCPGSGLEMETLKFSPHVEESMKGLSCEAEVREKDLIQKLQVPIPGTKGSSSGYGNIIIPRPVRPIGSSITVNCITHPGAVDPVVKQPEEVENEVEMESLPSVVSDSKNKVRLANSAYKEMVGQPECPWLDSVATSKRISGEVMLDLPSSLIPIPSNGFSCRVKIQWASNGQEIFIIAPCDVMRVHCESKDYLFTWRFHTSEALTATKA